MVLSNKKLKQQLRASVAESLTQSVSETTTKSDPNLQVQSLKQLITTVTQKPKLSKREKRRKDLPFRVLKTTLDGNKSNREDGDDAQKENKEISGTDDLSDKKKKKKKEKKRKREEVENKENGGSESAEKKPAEKKPASKKKKKKNKKKQKKNKKEDKVVVENGGNLEEPVKIEESQENVELATKVYVGGIPFYSTEDDIRSFFESCGTITEMDCMTFPESGKFRGIAMITFKTEAAAKRALALDGADMGGLFLKIQPYKTTSKPQKPSADFAPKIVEGYNRVYVGNLSWDITEDDLKQLFSDCKISSIRFGIDKETEEFKGYAHVDFDDSLSLAIALKLDQKEVCGRPARVRCAVPKKEVKAAKVTMKSEEVPKIEKVENNITDAATNTTSINVSTGGGKKRRTCYECGVPGHISSDCPKKEVEAAKVSKTSEEVPKIAKVENNVTDAATTAAAATTTSNVSTGGGKKRRTCYECGVPGHISSDCPKKEVEAANVSKTSEEVPKIENKIIDAATTTTSMNVSTGGGKKRRTCYECGVAGHISTDCPKRTQVAADPVTSN